MRRRRRYRAKYDLFPSDMFNTRDLNWYPPSDYRTAVVGNEGEEPQYTAKRADSPFACLHALLECMPDVVARIVSDAWSFTCI